MTILHSFTDGGLDADYYLSSEESLILYHMESVDITRIRELFSHTHIKHLYMVISMLQIIGIEKLDIIVKKLETNGTHFEVEDIILLSELFTDRY